MICALIYNFVCSSYFFDANHIAEQETINFSARTNILYCAVYFTAGGLIYLYQKELAAFSEKHKIITSMVLLGATIAYYVLGGSTATMLAFCMAALIFALGCKRCKGVLANPVTKFLGGISFEIYLCHMVIYRMLEKLHLIHLINNSLIAYIFTAIAVICGSVVFSACAKWFINKVQAIFHERVNRRSE